MPTADEWSIAIAEWATVGRRKGERIFLSLDAAALDRLAVDQFDIQDGFQDFLRAVRDQLVVSHYPGWTATQLKLPVYGSTGNGAPKCTAFLALLVVCAARRGERMPDYQGRGNSYFFPWLRKLLGGKPVTTRSGLGELDAIPAPELRLWREWAKYVQSLGFKSVPETTYEGPWMNSGYALDQAILTVGCRAYLRSGRYDTRSLRSWMRRRDAHRLTDPPIPGATKHLKGLLVERWDDEHVREAVLGAIEGAPPGPRPGNHHFTVIRVARGDYYLRVDPPSGWQKRITCGDAAVSGGKVQLSPSMHLGEFVFQVGQAVQMVHWHSPSFIRFFVPLDPLSPSRSGEPELGEEHFLLIPHEELSVLEAARDRGDCGWDSFALWSSWIEFEGFRMNVPRIQTGSGTLRVKSHGGVIFQGGIRTGEPGRTPRILAMKRGGVRAAEGAGMAKLEEIDISFELSENALSPLPDLELGQYHLHFGGVRTKFEIVDWRAVIYDDPEEPKWLC